MSAGKRLRNPSSPTLKDMHGHICAVRPFSPSPRKKAMFESPLIVLKRFIRRGRRLGQFEPAAFARDLQAEPSRFKVGCASIFVEQIQGRPLVVGLDRLLDGFEGVNGWEMQSPFRPRLIQLQKSPQPLLKGV